MSTSKALRDIFKAARPLIGEWLDIGEQIAALRDTATAAGLDWSAVKALIKAQIQDERDNNEGKRVTRILEKAEFASSYADMLGFTKMNEENFIADEDHDPETGEVLEDTLGTAETILETEPAAPVHAPAQVRAAAPGGVAPLLAGAEGDTDRHPIPLAADAPHAAQTVGNPPPDTSPAESETVAISALIPATTDGGSDENAVPDREAVNAGGRLETTEARRQEPSLSETNTAPAGSVADEISAPIPGPRKNPFRPHCQKPHACGSSNPRAHCFSCQELLAEAEGFTP